MYSGVEVEVSEPLLVVHVVDAVSRGSHYIKVIPGGVDDPTKELPPPLAIDGTLARLPRNVKTGIKSNDTNLDYYQYH
jgi:hypothetical protein